ncbi:MAG: hypothetical protein JJD92_04755 [Frankiaceae bacterium]|nr:hypothetical protein [Frankiaceae bacterium]
MRRALLVTAAAALMVIGIAPEAGATPVCTDGYKGGPPAATCGNRIFPESALTKAYVQYNPDPTGFREYEDGLAYLAQKYARYVQVFSLDARYGKNAVTAGPDQKRSYENGDTGDGHKIWVIRLTDRQVPDAGKKKLFFSLSVHGNERGGLEGGLRAVEDLAVAATQPDATISDGVAGYASATGRKPVIHTYSVREVLGKEDVYLTDFNIDGWEIGDNYKTPTAPYARANSMGTDLNRQMPTIGSINTSRNPLRESEAKYGVQLINDLAKAAGGRMSYGADVHGELTSRAYVDIMYPAGQFDSVKHRQLMAIAERTKSVIDATLFAGIQDQIENGTGGDEGEGIEDTPCHIGPPGCITETSNTVPTKPAHWATVWDTLGYTDTGFIGDYLATDAAVTGMDYEIFLNHTVPDKAWNVYLQENHINASRAIIKTAMAYALFQDQEFNRGNVRIETGGQPGYVLDPTFVTNTDANGPGELPGPKADGIGRDGSTLTQRPYKASRMSFFTDSARLMPRPYAAVLPADIANDPKALDRLDSLVLADVALPKDGKGRAVNATKYYANIAAWVKRGGNLVLTDKALHALGDLGIVDEGKVKDIKVYQPYSDIPEFTDPLVAGLRSNARQLVEAAILGYGIGGTASPMTAVDPDAFTAAGGKVVGTTNDQVTLGRIPVGKGRIQLVGGALPTPTEDLDHRYGLRDYGLTYSGLYIMENAIRYDAPGLGAAAPAGFSPVRPGTPAADAAREAARRERLAATGADVTMATVAAMMLLAAVYLRRRRRVV